jgi:hypothetical protein
MPWVDENTHVTLGPEAHAMSADGLRSSIDDIKVRARQWYEQSEAAQKALEGLPFVAVPIDQLADIYERLKRLTALGQSTIDEWLSASEEVRLLKRAVFEQSDFGALYAGQWLPKEVRERIIEKMHIPSPPQTKEG